MREDPGRSPRVVAPLADQIRSAYRSLPPLTRCARLSLIQRMQTGQPSMIPPLPKPPASNARRTLAPPSGSADCAAAPQSCPILGELALFPASSSPFLLLRTAALRLVATVSSSSNKAIPTLPAPGKPQLRSACFLPARKTDSATSPILAF